MIHGGAGNSIKHPLGREGFSSSTSGGIESNNCCCDCESCWNGQSLTYLTPRRREWAPHGRFSLKGGSEPAPTNTFARVLYHSITPATTASYHRPLCQVKDFGPRLCVTEWQFVHNLGTRFARAAALASTRPCAGRLLRLPARPDPQSAIAPCCRIHWPYRKPQTRSPAPRTVDETAAAQELSAGHVGRRTPRGASFQNAIHFETKNGFRALARANGGIW